MAPSTRERSTSLMSSRSSSPPPTSDDDSGDEAGAVQSGLSTTQYAQRSQNRMKLIQQLRAVGAQADVDLPRIAVIGNQSAGKSSLVEAISGIKVPRDSGTCTRCPMECRLSQSTHPWQCQLSLRFEFDNGGRRKDDVREVIFGKPVMDRDNVELAIRRAQAAILNPSIPYTRFLELPERDIRDGKAVDGQKPLAFSKNIVCLDISGPDVTDLSFVDLPGIIQNAETELVSLVESLVVSHIKGNCLILVALPMSDDIENQKAALLAKQQDPEGRRTIGVLTKPDALTSGNMKAKQLWLDVLHGQRHPLLHGYYCTRQPDEDERAEGITFEEARMKEMNYFGSTVPWSSSTEPKRFGTINLAKRLSELLTQIIDDGLPKLQAEIIELHERCLSQLRALPPRVSDDPSGHLTAMINKFCNQLSSLVRGAQAMESLVQANRESYIEFCEKIKSTAPIFHASLRSDSATEDLDEGSADTLVMYLDDVHDHIKKSTTRELPFNVPYPSKVQLIRMVTATWKIPVLRCFDRVYSIFLTEIVALVDKHFNRFGRLQSSIKAFVAEEMAARKEATLATLHMFLKFEEIPFTQNLHYLSDTREKWLTRYQEKRKADKAVDDEPKTKADQNVALAALAKLGYTNINAQDFVKLISADEYQEEMTLMADVRSYFSVSHKRLIDNVPLAIDHTFLFQLADIMQDSLVKKLRVSSPESAQSYLSEDPMVHARREELTVQRNRLDNMRKELFNFGL